MPARLLNYILWVIQKDRYKQGLKVRKLKANYDKFWQSDSDACNSIDPFMAILFFRANDFDVVNYAGLLDKLLVRTNELILLKQ